MILEGAFPTIAPMPTKLEYAEQLVTDVLAGDESAIVSGATALQPLVNAEWSTVLGHLITKAGELPITAPEDLDALIVYMDFYSVGIREAIKRGET